VFDGQAVNPTLSAALAPGTGTTSVYSSQHFMTACGLWFSITALMNLQAIDRCHFRSALILDFTKRGIGVASMQRSKIWLLNPLEDTQVFLQAMGIPFLFIDSAGWMHLVFKISAFPCGAFVVR
jgi:hypothetical protein